MRNILIAGFVGLVIAHFNCGTVNAGIVDPPFATDVFNSRADLTLILLPAWTGQPNNVNAPLQAFGPTTVIRELNPFVQGGLDTIDTEITNLSLTGTGIGFPVQIRAGAGNGFLPGLGRSGGQIQDLLTSPLDGVIDFPADSIFDIFFDVWIDLDFDMMVDVGEVVRNFDAAIRMQQSQLAAVPPPVNTQYMSVTAVDVNDPNIGMFNATLFLPPTIDLFVVLPDGSRGDLHAQISADGGHFHTVIPIPEPGSFGLGLIGLCMLTGLGRRRNRLRR